MKFLYKFPRELVDLTIGIFVGMTSGIIVEISYSIILFVSSYLDIIRTIDIIGDKNESIQILILSLLSIFGLLLSGKWLLRHFVYEGTKGYKNG
jgi:hypothetical protein